MKQARVLPVEYRRGEWAGTAAGLHREGRSDGPQISVGYGGQEARQG